MSASDLKDREKPKSGLTPDQSQSLKNTLEKARKESKKDNSKKEFKEV